MQEWLIWTGIGLSSSLLSFGVNPWVAQLGGFTFFFRYGVLNVDMTQVVRSILIYSTEIFFREVSVRALRSVPEGHVLLACGPHSNQFIDPIIVLRAAARRVRFIAAAKSMRLKFVGFMAAAMDSIGVERAQDLTKVCTGLLKIGSGKDAKKLKGVGTKFIEEIQKGDSVWIDQGEFKGKSAAVLEVVSDTELLLKAELPQPSDPVKFKKSGSVDSSAMFSEVTQVLVKGGTVGIFPEGGSHDRTSMLPFKPGIAVMALKTLSEYPDTPLHIVPVGINYSQAHRFRSRVFVEFGDAIQVPPETLAKYKEGGKRKIEAGNELLAIIEQAHTEVTVQCEDYETRKLLWALRRLYSSATKASAESRKVTRLGLQKSNRFNILRGLADGYESVKGHSSVLALMAKVAKYERLLRAYGIHDNAVANRLSWETAGEDHGSTQLNVMPLLLCRLLKVFVYLIVCVPGLVLASPVVLLTRIVAQKKAASALAGSNVKIAGRDVMATWKVLIGLVFIPALHIFYTGVVYSLSSQPYSVLYFFFMPFVSAYSIKIFEDFFELVGSIWPLMLLVFSAHQASRLVDLREELEEETVATIREVGWMKDSRGGSRVNSVADLAALDCDHEENETQDELSVPRGC